MEVSVIPGLLLSARVARMHELMQYCINCRAAQARGLRIDERTRRTLTCRADCLRIVGWHMRRGEAACGVGRRSPDVPRSFSVSASVRRSEPVTGFRPTAR